MDKWNSLANEKSIQKAVQALNAHNFQTIVVNTKEEAKQKVLELIPKGSEVMTMTSKTLEAIGLTKEFNESGDYKSIRAQMSKLDREKDKKQMKILAGTPEFAIGSVHAITEDGHVLIASGSGSQLPAYVYGANKVIWIAGTQKIVKNIEEGMKRVEEHSLPLESERMKQLHGIGSRINRLLIFNGDYPGRVTLILVKENLGF